MSGPQGNPSEEECPACGGQLIRHEVDIGVGIQYGPRHCMDCVWQEPEADHGIVDGPEEDWENALDHF